MESFIDPDAKLATVADVAEVLGVSTWTVRRYIAEGRLEAVNFGQRLTRVKLASVNRLVATSDVRLHGRGAHYGR